MCVFFFVRAPLGGVGGLRPLRFNFGHFDSNYVVAFVSLDACLRSVVIFDVFCLNKIGASLNHCFFFSVVRASTAVSCVSRDVFARSARGAHEVR